MTDREEREARLGRCRERLELYYRREAEMLGRGAKSYGIGSRNVSRYDTALKEVQDQIATLEREVRTLERALSGRPVRRSAGLVPRDW